MPQYPEFIIKMNKLIKRVNYSLELLPRSHSINNAKFRSYEPIIQDEPLIYEFISQSQPGEVLYDIGASVGVYSLVAASLGLDSIAFEPNPETYSRLIKNVEANDFDCISSYNMGIYNEVDELEFYVSSQPPRSSFKRKNATYGSASVVRKEKIPVTSLDELKDDIAPPDHLKIDVEGLGYKIVQGAESIISDARPIIYFEPHGNDYIMKDWLQDHNYMIEELGYPWLCTPAN